MKKIEAQVWRMCVVRARVALARARVCMQGMTRAHVKMKCKENNGIFHVYCSYAFVANQCISISITCILSYSVVCTRMYSYVTRMLLVCTLCVTRMLLVCSFSHDRPEQAIWFTVRGCASQKRHV